MTQNSNIPAKTHPTFEGVFKKLVVNQFYQEIDRESLKENIDKSELEKAIWLASLIATSDSEKDKYLASVFGIALFLEHKDSIEIQKAAYIILSRSGNLISSNFFVDLISFEESNRKPSFKGSFGAALDIELGAKMALNQINILDEYLSFSDYQRKLWRALEKDAGNIAVSAPTSAGKSFIIQSYLAKCFNERDQFKAVYIVPTRALIAQVSDTLKKRLPVDVVINTAFIEKSNNSDEAISEIEYLNEQFSEKEIFVLTPERCLKLIQFAYNNSFEPDIIFIDEIQNIENQDSRGFFFEFLLNEITSNWSNSRIITAGPFLEDPSDLFRLIFHSESLNLQTIFSPVFQLKIGIRPSENDSKITAKIYFQEALIDTIDLDISFNYSQEIRNKARTMIQLVSILGKSSKNIVYFPRTDYAEKYAVSLSQTILENNSNPPEISNPVEELVQLISEEIHPSYYLIDALKSNTAFHHGKLPEIIRSELEYLFSAGYLQNIVCTSTLMEGVNLPAEKIFIAHPKKDTIPLSKLEFGNIIGRAGRIKDSLIGSIFCIENQEETWAEENLTNGQNQKIEPAIQKILSKPIEGLLEYISKPLDEVPNEMTYAISFLKHKFLQGDQVLSDYLTKKGLNANSSKDAIIDGLENRLSDLTIPSELVKLNPSIDPEIQNEFYTQIISQGIEDWVIFENNRLFTRISKEARSSLLRKNDNLYGQLEYLIFKIDSIVDLSSEAFFKHKISRSVKQMVLYATKWIRNASMNQLIREELNFYANIHSERLDLSDRDKVNRKINEVIKIYSTIVSFVLVKYLKLLSDLLNFIFTEEEKETFKLTLSLPTYLELGTLNVAVLDLISHGMSRSIAIKVGRLVPQDRKETAYEWLKEQNSIDIPRIYVKYLIRKGFMKNELSN